MKPILNHLLNHFSMYRFVSIALTSLWVVSLLFSFSETLAYPPLALIASAATLVSTTYLASLLFGTLFGIRIHSESSYITALILFFIFTPTLELSGLLALGLTGIIAAASKFILTMRSRHIFNPAAIAAFIISMTGLAFASWWVATPPLFATTLLLALLVLYKTRRLFIGGLFMILASLLVITTLLLQGSGLAESIALLASWPVVFFAGFMLSEPLTLPPKKWQQVIEVVVVGLLFAVPIHVGNFVTNPAIALIVGNIISFCLSWRRGIALTLTSSKKLTPSSREFTLSNAHKLRYEAGQYVEITLPHKSKDMRGIRRVFSLTSAPDDAEIKFAAKFYDPSSTFKQALQSLPRDSIITATGISGDFTLPKDSAAPLLYIAGGIGITPFVSHLRHLQNIDEKRDIILIYSVSDRKDIAFKDILAASGISVYVLSPTKPSDVPEQGWHYLDAPYITKEIIEEVVPDIALRYVYASGPPALVDSAKRIAKQLDAQKTKTDYFTGY